MQIILYTETNTARLQYIVDFVFSTVLQTTCCITTDILEFERDNVFRINYSTKPNLKADLTIIPHSLLCQKEIIKQTIEIFQWEDKCAFFKTSDGIIPFDIFSAAFYLISRYEEYLPYEGDLHDRYPAENSLAYQHSFLHTPLVDHWIIAIKNMINEKNSAVLLKEKTMSFLPTYDIDMAYSYLGKGLLRNVGGSFRDLISGSLAACKQRINVLLGKEVDPFDSFDFLDQLHHKFQLQPIYFLLLSNGSQYDKNIDPAHPLMKKLVIDLNSKYAVGIHPSYRSSEDENILAKEISLIQTTKSRQHYIKFKIPQHFRQVIKLGIKEEYSMGYGSMNGFRASTTHPHQWFDVENNKVTDLMIYPFCYMECNSFYEQKINASEALNEMLHYANEVKKVGGTLITIWHNFSLGTEAKWQDWKKAYQTFIEKIHIINES